MINYNEIVKEVAGRVATLEGKYAQKIAAAILGAEIDCWGDVKAVSPTLVDEVSKDSSVKAAIANCRERIAAEIRKPIAQKTINGMARRIKDRLMDSIEEKVYHELYDAVEDEISLAIREKIIADSKLAPYLVAGRVKGVVK